jgi:DNA (cytosine-5)-methyltransferase 1
MLVLSLFSGIGLLDMAFEAHGFCVVRGPDSLWGGDICTFHPPAGRFDLVVGGPPCQRFSRLAHMVRHNGYELAPDLIPEFARCVIEAQPRAFLMENVPAAPCPVTPGYAQSVVVLNNRQCGGVQNRERRFVFGVRGEKAVSLLPHLDLWGAVPGEWAYAVVASSGGNVDGTPIRLNSGGKVKKVIKDKVRSELPPNARNGRTVQENCRLQGLPGDFLDDAPFTVAGKLKAIGNGVPLPMGKAIAGAVKAALEKDKEDTCNHI